MKKAILILIIIPFLHLGCEKEKIIDIRDKFVGTYTGEFTYGVTIVETKTRTISIEKNESSSNGIIIKNFYVTESTNQIKAKAHMTTLLDIYCPYNIQDKECISSSGELINKTLALKLTASWYVYDSGHRFVANSSIKFTGTKNE